MTENQNQVVTRLRLLVKEERRITNEILDLINEADRTRVYLELGFSSLFSWLTQDLGYSDGSAQRRIEAARLLRVIPEAKTKLESGELKLMAISNLGTAIRREEVRTRRKLDLSSKRELLTALENKSSKEAERAIAEAFPEVMKTQESLRAVAGGLTSLKLTLSDQQMKKLERVRDLTSHSDFGASWADLIEKLSDDFLKRNDPLVKEVKARKKKHNDSCSEPKSESKTTSTVEVAAKSSSADGEFKNKEGLSVKMKDLNLTSTVEVKPSSRTRMIPAHLKREIFKRDHGQCTYRDSRTNRVCGSRYQVEIDHVTPFSLGGESTLENLRCLCRAHNQHRGKLTFGDRRWQ